MTKRDVQALAARYDHTLTWTITTYANGSHSANGGCRCGVRLQYDSDTEEIYGLDNLRREHRSFAMRSPKEHPEGNAGSWKVVTAFLDGR